MQKFLCLNIVFNIAVIQNTTVWKNIMFGSNNFGGSRNFGGRRDTGPREMTKVTCSDCGKECEVPFKPTEGRPVYCRDCLPKHQKPRF
jgi:CxxC-x17-CxxC domain-containing protein